MHRIMLVDDQPLFRNGLKRILGQDDRLGVVAEATSGQEVLRLADIPRPALVLMDVQLPVVSGLQIASALRRQRPNTSIIFLSMHTDGERLFAAIRVGVTGFLTKDADPSPILATVHAVLPGENLLQRAVLTNPNLVRCVLGKFRSLSDRSGEPGTPDVALSPGELDMLDCLVTGRSNKEIGESSKPSSRPAIANRRVGSVGRSWTA